MMTVRALHGESLPDTPTFDRGLLPDASKAVDPGSAAGHLRTPHLNGVGGPIQATPMVVSDNLETLPVRVVYVPVPVRGIVCADAYAHSRWCADG